MPSLQEIEQFKRILNSLGSEPEVLAERGEKLEELPLPQVGLSQELSELLESAAEAPATEARLPEEPFPTPAVPEGAEESAPEVAEPEEKALEEAPAEESLGVVSAEAPEEESLEEAPSEPPTPEAVSPETEPMAEEVPAEEETAEPGFVLEEPPEESIPTFPTGEAAPPAAEPGEAPSESLDFESLFGEEAAEEEPESVEELEEPPAGEVTGEEVTAEGESIEGPLVEEAPAPEAVDEAAFIEEVFTREGTDEAAPAEEESAGEAADEGPLVDEESVRQAAAGVVAGMMADEIPEDVVGEEIEEGEEEAPEAGPPGTEPGEGAVPEEAGAPAEFETPPEELADLLESQDQELSEVSVPSEELAAPEPSIPSEEPAESAEAPAEEPFQPAEGAETTAEEPFQLPEEFALPEDLMESAPEEAGPEGEPEAPPVAEPEEEAAAPAAPAAEEFELPEGFELPEETAEGEGAVQEGMEEFAGAGEAPVVPEDAEAPFAIPEGFETPAQEPVPGESPEGAPFAEAPQPEESLDEFELPEEFQVPVAEGQEEEPETGLGEGAGEEGPEGGIAVPAGEVELPDSGIGAPEGEVELPDSGVGVPEGEVELPESAVGVPEGEVELPDSGIAVPAGEVEAAPGAAGPEEQAGIEPSAEEGLGEEDFQIDEFSLQGLGEDFGVSEVEPGELQAQELDEAQVEAPGQEEEEIEAAEEELELTEEQFTAMQATMASLPKNLRMVIQELISEQSLAGEKLGTLMDLLVKGAAPASIAAQVSSIIGKKIVLPKRFEKRTGLAFEAERRTFAYAFRENILPIVKVLALSIAFISLLAFLGYRFVYQPIFAAVQYRRGYEHLLKDRYPLANERFDIATDYWAFKRWFHRYAEGFADKRQFFLAEQKYDQLLARWKEDRQGHLDYAHLETYSLVNYEKAERLLGKLLERNMKDYQALLASGDNYLEWAREDPSHYEDARFHYASILDYYGERDEVLFRMLRYFIRTDQLAESRSLKQHIDKLAIRVDPEVYAELGGYMMDRGDYDELPDALFSALEVRKDIPEIHYHLARYFRYAEDAGEEEKALLKSIHYLEQALPLTKERKARLIDSYNRYGEVFWRKQEYLDAEEQYQIASDLIETEQRSRTFGKRPDFGRVYKNRGDIYYYVDRNLDTARSLYRQAEDNLYSTSDLDYKMGYIDYMQGRYENALLRFSKVLDYYSANENILFSLANTLYQRGDFFAAQGHYLHLLDLLESKKNNIPFLRIVDNPEHRALMEYILKTYNNLGVTLKELSDRSGDPEKSAKALVNLTFSSENYDLLARDPETLSRSLTKNLAYLNQRKILYPTTDFDLQIYNRIPEDLESRRF